MKYARNWINCAKHVIGPVIDSVIMLWDSCEQATPELHVRFELGVHLFMCIALIPTRSNTIYTPFC